MSSNSGEFSPASSPGSSPLARLFHQFRKSPTTNRTPLSRTSSDDIHQVFNYFDENGDGKISASELQNRLQLSDEEAEMVVRSSDADGDGVLGLDDFAKMMEEGEEEEELRGAFAMYLGKSGSVITPKSLKKMMKRLGQAATVNDCKGMIQRFDVNRDGVLDFEEFRTMMS
ncbi:calcium-binding protein CML39-like [Bidens hawaiensis]|uniref:calcium-binding protein CML39-like n=1 Tax=Bidens hawaiensis TaxID=980011 RepID=UPI00404A7316